MRNTLILNTVHRRDRGGKTPGGGVVAVKSDFLGMREETLEDETSEIVWVQVTMKGCKNLYIAGCYTAKADDSAFLDALSPSLYRITRNSNNSVLLGGDFNFPGWDWMAGSVTATADVSGCSV